MKDKKVKSIKQKIIISLLIVMLTFTFVMPTYSQADFGGELIEPICDLLRALGDVANNLIGKTVGTGDSLLGSAVNKSDSGVYKALRDVVFDQCDGKTDEASIRAIFDVDNPSSNMKEKKVMIVGRNTDAVPEGMGYLKKKSDLVAPNIKVTPIEIFAGRVAFLDADFFGDTTSSEYQDTMIGGEEYSTAGKLKKVISNWYQGLRLIAIVGLLSVLVYVAIRMITSAVASDKAKYKQMFIDWVIALCLVFFLHYIMVFSMTMVKEIQKLFVTDNPKTSSKTINTILVNVVDTNGNTVKYSWNDAYNNAVATNPSMGAGVKELTEQLKDQDSGAYTGDVPGIFPTNLIGYNRILSENPDGWNKLTYTIMYLALTFYTIYFFFIYLKRIVILTFLTIIAPLVALTYPIDKVKDSRAQAFEYWLREYLVNAMLPIIHLVLYTILVTSAIDLVVESPLYAVCVLAFIVPAEKMIKSMFGIRSETAPAMGGFAGGALAAQALQRLGKGKEKSKESGGSNKIRTKDKNVTDPNIVEGDGLDALAAEDGNLAIGSGAAAATATMGANQDTNNQNTNNTNNEEDEYIGFGREYTDEELENLGANSGPSLQDSESGLPITNQDDLDVTSVPNTGKTESNFTKYLREKYDIPVGKTGKTLLKRAALGAGRVALRGSALIGGSAIGLAGGIVGGNMNDMWKGAMLGGIAGKAIGNKTARGIENTASSLSDAYNQITYGKKEAQNRQADAEFMNDIGNRQHVADKIMKENPEMKRSERNREIEKRMQEYAKYRRTGVTDIKEMDRIYDIKENRTASVREQLQSAQAANNEAEQQRLQQELSRQEEFAQKYAIEIANLSTHYDAGTFREANKTDNATKALARKFEKKGLSARQAKKAADNAMNQIRIVKGE